MGVLDDAIREHLALRRRHGVSESELERQEKEALGPARREPSPREAADQAPSASAEELDADVAASDDAPDAGVLTNRPPAGDRLGSDASAAERFEEYGAEPLEAGSEDETRISAAAALDDERILDEEEVAEEELADELAGREGGLQDAEGLPASPPQDPSGQESTTEEQTTVFSPPPVAPIEDGGDALAEEEPLTADERALDEEAALVDEEPLEEEAGAPEVDPLAEESPADVADAEEDEDVLEDTPDFLQETPEHERLWFEQKPPRDFDLDR